MIGTHDSFTYLKAKHKIYELFSFLWRTQTKSLEEQIENGVTYFDIRVHRTKDNQWELCHGLVNFDKSYQSLVTLLKELARFNVRLILEKSTKQDEIEFEKLIYVLKYRYNNLVFSAIFSQTNSFSMRLRPFSANRLISSGFERRRFMHHAMDSG